MMDKATALKIKEQAVLVGIWSYHNAFGVVTSKADIELAKQTVIPWLEVEERAGRIILRIHEHEILLAPPFYGMLVAAWGVLKVQNILNEALADDLAGRRVLFHFI